jgi:hypothetical protein
MENINEFEIVTSYGETVKHILIDHGNGEFTSMPKSEYDRQQAAQDTLPSKLAEKPSV